MELPRTETLDLRLDDGVLHLTLSRPDRKNAMNRRMVEELVNVFDTLAHETSVRAVVLRGAGGTFCAGADIKDLARGHEAEGDARAGMIEHNRGFGRVASLANRIPQPLVGALEGAVLGGGFGLACVTDVALALESTRFGLPETQLGLVPAQIAPFVVQRIGITQTRRIALTAARFDGVEARRLGLVHETHSDTASLDAAVENVLDRIRRCAPKANAATKRLVQRVGEQDLEPVLDDAAEVFADAALGEEGREGTQAFVEKRPPSWAR